MVINQPGILILPYTGQCDLRWKAPASQQAAAGTCNQRQQPCTHTVHGGCQGAPGGGGGCQSQGQQQASDHAARLGGEHGCCVVLPVPAAAAAVLCMAATPFYILMAPKFTLADSPQHPGEPCDAGVGSRGTERQQGPDAP